jgi:hypothetical protein
MKIWEPKPPGTLWVTAGLLRDSFTFMYYRLLLIDAYIKMQRIVGTHFLYFPMQQMDTGAGVAQSV